MWDYLNVKLVLLPSFSDWLSKETPKSRAQIEDRLSRIRDFGHFGDAKNLGDGLAELKWGNGRRVYFATSIDHEGRIIVLILGGNKNGQDKDIEKAKKILSKIKR